MYIVRFEKYVLCFEIGLSPSGSTQSQNKIYTFKPKGRLKKTKKTDVWTLSQKVGGGPDQIPKFVECEIGTRGGVGSQKPICQNFKGSFYRGYGNNRPLDEVIPQL